jgi:hypothetical protein
MQQISDEDAVATIRNVPVLSAASAMRFQTRVGLDALSSSASGPPVCRRSYQR